MFPKRPAPRLPSKRHYGIKRKVSTSSTLSRSPATGSWMRAVKCKWGLSLVFDRVTRLAGSIIYGSGSEIWVWGTAKWDVHSTSPMLLSIERSYAYTFIQSRLIHVIALANVTIHVNTRLWLSTCGHTLFEADDACWWKLPIFNQRWRKSKDGQVWTSRLVRLCTPSISVERMLPSEGPIEVASQHAPYSKR